MRVNLPNLYNTWRLRKSQHTNCMSKFIENSIAVHCYIKKPCTFQILSIKYLIILRMLTKECFIFSGSFTFIVLRNSRRLHARLTSLHPNCGERTETIDVTRHTGQEFPTSVYNQTCIKIFIDLLPFFVLNIEIIDIVVAMTFKRSISLNYINLNHLMQ